MLCYLYYLAFRSLHVYVTFYEEIITPQSYQPLIIAR